MSSIYDLGAALKNKYLVDDKVGPSLGSCYQAKALYVDTGLGLPRLAATTAKAMAR